MPANKFKDLVIDASVARSSGGEEAVFPTSKNCRDFLMKVTECCHKIVMSTEILQEWNRHQSAFARRWRVQMTARKKIKYVNVLPVEALRAKIRLFELSDKHRAAIEKDLLLIEAAIATDHLIVSLDEAVRSLVITLSTSIGELKNLVWVNPDKAAEMPLDWLQNGAQTQKERKIGAA